MRALAQVVCMQLDLVEEIHIREVKMILEESIVCFVALLTSFVKSPNEKYIHIEFDINYKLNFTLIIYLS